VSIVCRLCLVLIGVRLLVPPCVCLCQMTAPAARLVAGLLGRELPPAEPEDHDHHHEGCPMSKLSVGMGVPPASAPLLLAPGIDTLSTDDLFPDTASVNRVALDLAVKPPGSSLCLTLCALLI
jgi:hypothetical protein